MKNTEIISCIHVVSEPGDATHYDYAVHVNVDDYMFVPLGNSFAYPQKLNWWDVKELATDVLTEDVIKLAGAKNCNPYTLLECLRTMHELRDVNA